MTTLEDIRAALAGRRLIWFGIRGEDGESLLQLPEFAGSFAITAGLRSGTLPAAANITLEEIAGVRPDLDRYDLDLDSSEYAQDFRSRMLREVSSRCIVVTYRPSAFVSALAFSMNDSMVLGGLFKDRQSAFEHKPWVETSLTRRGVPTLGWRYIANEHRARVKRILADEGPLVLRASRSSGGVGMVRVESDEQIDELWPTQGEDFVGVAPYIHGARPLNLSGCVFRDGTVRLHPASMQLIGIASCTDRPFGYCGNDFAAVADIDPGVLARVDGLGREVGTWLFEERYFGAFGIDAMCTDDAVFFTEVNARFQGSSSLSAEIAHAVEQPDLFVDHVAATLGVVPSDRGLTLAEWAERTPARAHVVLHNLRGEPVRREFAETLSLTREARLAQVLPEVLIADAGAAVCRIVLSRRVTETGFELDIETEQMITDVGEWFKPAREERRVGVG